MHNSIAVLIHIVVFLVYCLDKTTHATDVDERSAHYWEQRGLEELETALRLRPIEGVAKNVILFIGDGMGVSTVTGARLRKAELLKRPGKAQRLVFEQLPHAGFSKTYSVDSQVTDSAAGATALLSGVKTNNGVLGLSGATVNGSCTKPAATSEVVTSILELAKRGGKRTGVVTTTRVTHATPAGAYAHTPSRKWEYYSPCGPAGYRDIASQLIDADIDVVMGGGRTNFFGADTADPEYPAGERGKRRDQRNLINEWITKQRQANARFRYVWNRAQFDAVNASCVDKLMGLFEPSHMRFDDQRANDRAGEPAIWEMTATAIRSLRQSTAGYFLLVEGGKIDLAHHDNQAVRAFNETLALDRAVDTALELVNLNETLVLVTADHSHVMTLAGYPQRNRSLALPVQGKADMDGLSYTSVGYANGPSGLRHRSRGASVALGVGMEQRFASLVPLHAETHGGEDVPIFAAGPWAHLVHSTHEQTHVAHVGMYAACLGQYARSERCDRHRSKP